MSIFSKFKTLAAGRRELDELGIDPFDVQIDRIISPTEGIIHGRHTILAGTNNYLGLTFDPECIAAARLALEHEGTGTTGSRMANGSYSGHRKLEQELAGFYGKRDGIVFSTGYLANLGMLSTLAGSDDMVLLDADCHASIYDGCRLGGAKTIRFRHNNAEDLAKRMRRLGERAENTLIIVEGLYSMLGDHALLKEIVDVKKEYGGYLLVDEAHSLGVLGERGSGLAEELGLLDDVDFIVGTFSKSLGGAGGFCVSDHAELDLIRYSSRPYIFTASPSPATIATTRQALRTLSAGSHLRKRLHDNAKRLHAGLNALGYTLGAQPSPVVAVVFEGKIEALQFWNDLLELGVYVNLMFPPATPNGSFLIRCSVSAAHTPEQIDTICEAFAKLRVTA
ncbi:MAG TPA: aminotransferase class I/II-fold pyridoxal phosphate-dependent enzyme [Gammaproteobacteria bacterium]|nr:aminotransferase class I/II-fold pyridoxal phosphate-dependent enzyme [Gammaproteobacteria bacterium]